MFATGVTVITTRKGEQVHGMTANAFMSVSLEPPLVLISVDRRTKMCGILHEGAHYGVSVLCETQSALSDRFAGRRGEELPEPRFDLVKDTPLVDGALAHFVARVERSYWGGDHSLFLGRVEYARQQPGHAAAVPRRPLRATRHPGRLGGRSRWRGRSSSASSATPAPARRRSRAGSRACWATRTSRTYRRTTTTATTAAGAPSWA